MAGTTELETFEESIADKAVNTKKTYLRAYHKLRDALEIRERYSHCLPEEYHRACHVNYFMRFCYVKYYIENILK